ncbi:ORC-CDC6 family AAA ATPase [Luteimonas sp. A478]
MIEESGGSPRNLFEVDNARYLSTNEVVETFVATDSFWRLLSAKNHIVLGARGSGKTALLRMLAHSHLSRYRDSRARSAIKSRSFIGFYLPAKADWVGGLKNKAWLSSKQREEMFAWRLNLASCIALANALKSCLECYIEDRVERIRVELRLATALGSVWLDGEPRELQRIDDVIRELEVLDYEKQVQSIKLVAHPEVVHEIIGPQFQIELFQPVKRGIRFASDLLYIPDTAVWMLCLDEAEALEEFHHRIINSYLRTHSDNLVFKVSTTPYGHKTLETNVGAGLSVGNDFEYVYIDGDMQATEEKGGEYPTREAAIFSKRASQSGGQFKSLKLNALLGDSVLLDHGPLTGPALQAVLAGVAQFGDESLKARAEQLSDDQSKFGNEIGRKIRGALMLRDARRQIRGQEEMELYSGTRMVIRCCDGNPRRLIRVFNKLLREGDWKRPLHGRRLGVKPISQQAQTRILRDFSLSVLARVQGEQYVGRELHEMLNAIGAYMSHLLHQGRLGSDTVSSIRVSSATPENLRDLVKSAVGLGLLYPNVHSKTPDEMPEREGVFRLAYVFAPHFYLLPRRGKSRQLEAMLGRFADDEHPRQFSIFDEGSDGNH